MAQMAATAGSVAIGSTIGHGLSNMLFGGSNHAAPVEQQAQAPPTQQYSQGANCEVQAKGMFGLCMLRVGTKRRVPRFYQVLGEGGSSFLHLVS